MSIRQNINVPRPTFHEIRNKLKPLGCACPVDIRSWELKNEFGLPHDCGLNKYLKQAVKEGKFPDLSIVQYRDMKRNGVHYPEMIHYCLKAKQVKK